MLNKLKIMTKTKFFGALINVRRFVLLAGMVVMTAMTGCAGMQASIPLSELESFTAKTEAERVMTQVRVRWEVRDDASKICSAKMPSLGAQNIAAAPIACAVWNVPTKECVIITNRKVAHVTLGHELRHCFEGHFH